MEERKNIIEEIEKSTLKLINKMNDKLDDENTSIDDLRNISSIISSLISSLIIFSNYYNNNNFVNLKSFNGGCATPIETNIDKKGE